MRLRFAIVTAIAALLGLASPAAATHRPGHQPGGGSNITISATPKTVKFGGAVTLSGKLTGSNNASRTVNIEQDPFPVDAFTDAGTATTNATGDWTFAHKPVANTRYRARSGGAESPNEDVMVRPAITFRLSDRTPQRGQRVRFSGRLCPEHDGVAIALQRRSGTTWRTVRRPVLKDVAGATCSSFASRLRVRRDGAYRARFLGDADHVAGNSRVRRANVG
jgi:hypothetical protein